MKELATIYMPNAKIDWKTDMLTLASLDELKSEAHKQMCKEMPDLSTVVGWVQLRLAYDDAQMAYMSRIINYTVAAMLVIFAVIVGIWRRCA